MFLRAITHFIILFSITVNLFATDTPITGVVLDSKTKDPLPFTNIVIAGKYKGSVSNREGQFTLNADELYTSDTLLFSYMGYKTYRLPAAKLKRKNKIFLEPISIDLKEIKVSYKALTAKQIVAQAVKRYDENHPAFTSKKQIFYHRYEQAQFPTKDQIKLKSSDFVGLDKNTFDKVLSMMPEEFTEYQDAIIDLYANEDEYKIIPHHGISMEEGSMEALGEEVEKILGDLFDDIEATQQNNDVYYKMKSGIISHKVKPSEANDSAWKEYRNDPDNYTVEAEYVRSDITSLLKNYGQLKSKNWEFLTDRSKYNYKKESVTSYNGEMVYKISFMPKNRGLFEGAMFIARDSYALLQLEFAFAEGKVNEKFQVLGFGHAMNFKRARVNFEKGKNGYFVKYINAEQHESASVNRKFKVMKKEKRLLGDKTLNEINMDLDMAFAIKNSRELLVMSEEEITTTQFEQQKEPLIVKFKREFAYTPEMWNNRTVLVPTKELQEFERK